MSNANYERADQMMDRVVAARWVAEAALKNLADAMSEAMMLLSAFAIKAEAEAWITDEERKIWRNCQKTLIEVRRMIASAKPAAGEEGLKK